MLISSRGTALYKEGTEEDDEGRAGTSAGTGKARDKNQGRGRSENEGQEAEQNKAEQGERRPDEVVVKGGEDYEEASCEASLDTWNDGYE